MTLDDLSADIFVINLKEREDRRRHIESELARIGCSRFTLFEAVKGQKTQRGGLRAGAIGLIQTYLLIHERCRDRNVLLIEDDCVFAEDFNQKMELYTSNIPKNWDMIYFGANHNYHVGKKTEKINDFCVKLNNSFTTHCVLLKSNVFSDVAEGIKNLAVPVDVMMAKLQKKYNAYSSIPALTNQLPGFSDIEEKVVDYDWLIN